LMISIRPWPARRRPSLHRPAEKTPQAQIGLLQSLISD
jgi:hypothetical protein